MLFSPTMLGKAVVYFSAMLSNANQYKAILKPNNSMNESEANGTVVAIGKLTSAVL